MALRHIRSSSVLTTQAGYRPHVAERVVSLYSTRVVNYYDVLGLTPQASTAQVKASYYRLSKQFHPDINKSAQAKTKFSAISEAYEVLGNKNKRRQYDSSVGGRPFSGVAGGSAGIDAEYQEFLRKHGQFGKKGSAPTGRTNIYDFDEFYRVHYGDAIKQKQQTDAAKEQYDEDIAEAKENSKRRVVVFGLFLMGLSLSMVKFL